MANRKNTSTPRNAAETQTGLHISALESLEGWGELEKSEQTTVRDETIELDKSLMAEGTARLAVGEHLYNIREILEPKRVWNKFVISITGFSRATAYRYIDLYTAAKTILPEPIMKAAMLKGMSRISLDAVRSTPLPPRTASPTRIDEYLDTISHGTRGSTEVVSDADTLKREAFNAVVNRYHRLPTAGRVRGAWITSLLGMLLSEHGVANPTSVTPVPVPETFRSVRGRPKDKAA